MAGGQERVLRRRIRSVQSTKKITRAMELIAASRIVRAQQRVAAARPYAERITEVIGSLARGGGSGDSPLLVQRETVSTVAYVVITADRGLAGAYNSNVIRTAERAITALAAEGRDYALVCVGRKAQSYFRFRGYRIDAAFTGFSEQPRYEDAKEVATYVRGRFESGDYDEVELAYTRFLSAGNQRVAVRRIMPIDPAVIEAAAAGGAAAEHEFEPGPEAILESLLPRYVEARIFAALLEGSASELAARQRAMKSATDNADELITRLTRQMNRARQDSITTEIMEIVGGAEALRQSGADESDYLADRMVSQDLFTDR